MKRHTVTLTERQLTLVRVALLQRLDRLKRKQDGYNMLNEHDLQSLQQLQASYDDIKAMMDTGGVLSLSELAKAQVPKEVRKTARQREIETLSRNADISEGL